MASKRKFEYMIHDFNLNDGDGYRRYTTPTEEQETFDAWGNDGWELVAVSENIAYFKKEITNE